MDLESKIAMVFALIGVLATVGWFVLGAMGVKRLGRIDRSIREKGRGDG